ncbi:hypothetical protein [Nocardioides pocheonensis]|nr:hypothetical protein [Nocardioides pocheonensis]
MSSDAPGPRPRQVTIGGWLVAIASAMLVVTVFDTMARLHTVDTRDELTRVLTTGSTRDLGISVADALGVFRAALFVAGAAAAVTGVLGIFVLQRHTAARIVLTIAAVPVVLTAPFSGGFLAILVGGGTALLWSRPARDWFAGRPPTRPEVGSVPVQPAPQPPVRRPESAWPPPTIAPPRPSASPGSAPAPTPGWGRQSAQPASWPPAYVTAPAPAPGTRDVPTQVRVACILTWVFSALTGGLYLLISVALLADRGGMLKLLKDNPTVRDTKLTDDQLVAAIVTVGVLVVLWCLAAGVLAALVWRRHAWARTLLMVSIAVAFSVELVGFPYTLLHLAAAVIAFRMLLRPVSRAWFRGAGRPGPPPPPRWTPPPGWAPPSGAPKDQPAAPPDPGAQPPRDEPSDRPAGKPPVW